MASFIVKAATAPAQDVAVNYSMSGNATFGPDYILTGPTSQIIIKAGRTSGRAKLKAKNDHVAEGTETATMTLQPGPGYTIGAKNQATVSISDGP
jgi:hypothetical protein